jgi:excisionase family DNA binding protein
MTDRVLLVPEVAERLRVREWTVRRLIREGRLPVVRVGASGQRGLRIMESELERFLRGQHEPVANA